MGVTKTTSEWARQIGISQNAFTGRINSGWTGEELLKPKFKPLKMSKAEMAKEIRAWRNAEEQGLLMRLPCKVGTEVYYILGIPNKTPCTIDKCVFELSDIDKIGESLFLTREEAEKKLEEMKNDKA